MARRKPRLFFSHSTPDGSDDRKILLGIAEGLKASCEILLDRTALEGGGDWRSIINVWIATCDAAVILVTPESIERDYCRYEWAVLSFRHRHDNFLIIPIFHRSKPGDIAGRADQISAISGYKYDSIPSVTQKVTEKLLAELVLKERAQMQISYIAKSLQEAVKREEVIDTAADDLDLDLGTWDFSSDKWLKFAIKIMGVGLAPRALTVLQNLQQFFPKVNEEQFNDIIDLIGFCSWVDLSSAQRIKACAAPDATARLLGLNASKPDTARCYVLSGSERIPRTNWPIGIPHGVFASYLDLHRGVQSALLEALALAPDTTVEKLKKRLDLLRAAGKPVFVVLTAEGLDPPLLKQLRENELFSWVSFLVLTGEAAVAPGLLPEDAWLKPPLPAGFEDKVWSNYEDAKDFLQS